MQPNRHVLIALMAMAALSHATPAVASENTPAAFASPVLASLQPGVAEASVTHTATADETDIRRWRVRGAAGVTASTVVIVGSAAAAAAAGTAMTSCSSEPSCSSPRAARVGFGVAVVGVVAGVIGAIASTKRLRKARQHRRLLEARRAQAQLAR